MRSPQIFTALLFAALSGMALAQQPQPPTGYHSVTCVKVKPDKGAEYRKWWEDEGRKYMQATVDSGTVQTYYRLRAVMPAGTSAECDLVLIQLYPGLPPEPPNPEQMAAVLKRAGLSLTPQEFIQHRDALRTLVSYQVFQNQASVGSIAKGDYLAVSYMKTSNINDWLTMEKSVWQPVASAMIKDGIQKGWSVNLLAMPYGDDLPYQGVSVDVYPTLEGVFNAQNDANFEARLKRVFPNEDLDAKMTKAIKTRTQSFVRLFQADDVISSAK